MKLKYMAAVLLIGTQTLNAWGWNSDERSAVEDFFKKPAVQAIPLFAERSEEYQAMTWNANGEWESGAWSNGDDLIGHIIHNYELGVKSEDEAIKKAMLSVRHAVWLLNVNSGLQQKFGPIKLS